MQFFIDVGISIDWLTCDQVLNWNHLPRRLLLLPWGRGSNCTDAPGLPKYNSYNIIINTDSVKTATYNKTALDEAKQSWSISQ